MKHTPGPWKSDVSLAPRFCQSTGVRLEDVTSAWIRIDQTTSIACLLPVEEVAANARLMAAAPEMIDILRGYEIDCPCVTDDISGRCPHCKRTLELIAKIEGA